MTYTHYKNLIAGLSFHTEVFPGFGALSLLSLDIRIRKNSRSGGKSLQEKVKKAHIDVIPTQLFLSFL